MIEARRCSRVPTMSEHRPSRFAERFAVGVPYESSSKLSTSTSSFSSKSTAKVSNVSHHKKTANHHSHEHKSITEGQGISEGSMKQGAQSETDESLMMKEETPEDDATKPSSMVRRPSGGLVATAPESSSCSGINGSSNWKPSPATDIVIPISQDDGSNSEREMDGVAEPTLSMSMIAVDRSITLPVVENCLVPTEIYREKPNSKHYCKRCTKRKALIMFLLFIAAAWGAITAAVLLLADNDSEGGSSQSTSGGQTGNPLTNSPVTPFPTTTPAPSNPMTSPTLAPNESLTLSPEQSTPTPTVTTTTQSQESFEEFGSISAPRLQGFGSPFSISSNGRLIAVISRNSSAVEIHQTDGSGRWTLQQTLTLPVTSIALSGDGLTMAVGSDEVVTLFKYESETWSRFDVAIPYAGFSVDLSHDGTFLSVGSYAEASTFSVDTENLTWELMGYIDLSEYNEGGTNVAVAADGELVAVGSIQKVQQGFERRMRVVLYNAQLKRKVFGPLRLLQGSFVTPSLSLSENGSVLAIGRNDDTMSRVSVFHYDNDLGDWQARSPSLLPQVSAPAAVSLSESGNTLAVNFGDQFTRIYRFRNEFQSWELVDAPPDVVDDLNGSSVMLSGDGSVVAIGDAEQEQVNLFKLS